MFLSHLILTEIKSTYTTVTVALRIRQTLPEHTHTHTYEHNIIYFFFTPLEFFMSVLADGFSLEFE